MLLALVTVRSTMLSYHVMSLDGVSRESCVDYETVDLLRTQTVATSCYMKLEDADMAQNLQVGPKLGNIKKVLFLLFILLFILLY